MSAQIPVKSGAVLATLAASQFLMTLDSSVMNVSIATVATDVDSSVTGVQTAITLYTLVMAAAMITGGKLGQIIGRRRAFAIGCAVYGAGSLLTALAQNLVTLLIGWSLLEGLGAALILPSIVAMIADNFDSSERPRAYGLVAAAGAIAVAVGPLVGGAFTSYLSWRYVFVGEVVLVVAIVIRARRIPEAPRAGSDGFDLLGAILSAVGLGLVVLGVLRAGTWGFIEAKPGQPAWFGLSPSIWMIGSGVLVLWAFMQTQIRLRDARLAGERDVEPMIDPTLFESAGLRAGLGAFFMQFLLQAGVFFTIPLFLSVALGLSAVETGARLLPLSATLLIAAVGVPRLFPEGSPRRLCRVGFGLLLAGIVVLLASLDFGAGPEIITWPLLLIGLGIGTLASQLGAVTVSSVSDDRSGEVGGLQNTATNLGASIGTALAGAVLISALTTSLVGGLLDNPAVPESLIERASVQMTSGVPFVSDAQIETALDRTDLPEDVKTAIVDENEEARIRALRQALAVLAVIGVVALLTTGSLPRRPLTTDRPTDAAAAPPT